MRIKPNPSATPASTTSVADKPASAPSNDAAASQEANASAADAGASVFERAVSRSAAVEGGVAPAGPKEVAERFYDAFVHGRFDEMEALYAEDVTFKDDIFRYQDRAGTMGMWRKLLAEPGSVKASYRFDRVEGDVAIGRWQADYELFGRKVHNDIESRLRVVDGKIVAHTDDFDFAKWARQALPLGPLVKLPGVQPLLSGLIRLFAG